MNDNSVPNPVLRAYATDNAFVLSLRKTHIQALAAFANSDRSMCELRGIGVPDFFVTAAKALVRRGLVVHRHEPPFVKSKYPHALTDYYRLTKAGWAVFDLLVEAGLVQPLQKPSLRKFVA